MSLQMPVNSIIGLLETIKTQELQELKFFGKR